MHARLNAPEVATRDLVQRRERRVLAAGIALLVAASWLYMVPTARDMYGSMSGPAAWMMNDTWDSRYAALIFVMWAVMMVGMMLPSATPAILVFSTIVRGRPAPVSPLLRTSAFAGGYLLTWIAFSVGATALQWALARASLLSPMMESASLPLSGAIVIAAGLYQMTPLKQSCLSHCRSPVSDFARRWRPGLSGALRMGMEHGLYCTACCWALMLLLFAAGVMSLAAIAAITVFVLLEKVVPLGTRGGIATGVPLLLVGAWLLACAAAA